MTGIERRQYEMLVRVRNFGDTNQALFDSSPVARQTFAAVALAIDELTAAGMQKLAASASARADRREAAALKLRQLLQHVSQLARTLREEGRALPAFVLPRSKSALALLTTGRQFAVDVAPLDADFAGHGMSAAHIRSTTAALEAALTVQGTSRTEFVAARARIHEVLAGAVRSVKRLDLIVANDFRDNAVVQAQWAQLRQIEDLRASRSRKGGSEPRPPAQAEGPAPVPVAVAPALRLTTEPSPPQVV